MNAGCGFVSPLNQNGMDTIEYDFYENPSKSAEYQKSGYHIRICRQQTVGTETVVRNISKRCTLTAADIRAVLTAFQDEIAGQLGQGNIVRLDGLCRFSISLKPAKEVCTGKESGSAVVLKSVNITPDKELTRQVEDSLAARVKSKGEHSERLSETEIQDRLTGYFKQHRRITRSEMQHVCSLTRYMAAKHISRLVEEGRLENIGYAGHPVYVPVPGNFGTPLQEENAGK